MRIFEQFALKNDEIVREQPSAFQKMPREAMGACVNVYPVKKQKVFGFGGAFTESAAINFARMSCEEKEKTLEALFGESGLKYNFCRVCIGPSDFGQSSYSYVSEDDVTLESFDISRDKKYVIPFIREALRKTKGKMFLFASPWSPPAFMKDNQSLFGGGKLKKDKYELYAQYIVKFLKAYREEEIAISAVTLQNEPNAIQTWESCLFTAEEEAEYGTVLYEILNKNGLGDVRILCWDHNKGNIFHRVSKIYPKMEERIWGAGFHWYDGEHFDELDLIRDLYPEKVLIETEFCNGQGDRRFSFYKTEILNNLKHGVNAICEWNLILDKDGGPYHNRNIGCNAPIVFKDKKAELSDIYKEMFMFSHFIAAGAQILYTSSYSSDIGIGAAKNPDGRIVVCLLNTGRDKTDFYLKIGEEYVALDMDPMTVKTLLLLDEAF